MNMDLLDFAGVETLEMTDLESVSPAGLASCLGRRAHWEYYFKRRNGEAFSRSDARMSIAKTLIVDGRSNWEEFGLAINVAMQEFDRLERADRAESAAWKRGINRSR